MNDCPRAEIRDRLPDLVHGHLDGEARAAVSAHVETCAECRAELELLRSLYGMFVAQVKEVDIARVVAAVPSRPVRAIRSGRPQRTWFDWRIAAAAAMLLVGGGSVVVYDRVGASGAARGASIAEVDAHRFDSAADSNRPAAVSQEISAPVASTGPVESVALGDGADDGAPSVGLGLAGRLTDLDDGQLEALLDDIETLQAVPMADPDPVSIQIGASGAMGTGSGGGA